MRRPLPLLAACASFACLGASADTPTTDGGAEKNESAEVDCVTPDEADCDDAEEYWTPERMRNAKPLPTPVLDPETKKPVEKD